MTNLNYWNTNTTSAGTNLFSNYLSRESGLNTRALFQQLEASRNYIPSWEPPSTTTASYWDHTGEHGDTGLDCRHVINCPVVHPSVTGRPPKSSQSRPRLLDHHVIYY